MKKRHTIIEYVTRHLGSKGFDVTPTFEIADEADGTKPLIYYLISYFADLTIAIFFEIDGITNQRDFIEMMCPDDKKNFERFNGGIKRLDGTFRL